MKISAEKQIGFLLGWTCFREQIVFYLGWKFSADKTCFLLRPKFMKNKTFFLGVATFKRINFFLRWKSGGKDICGAENIWWSKSLHHKQIYFEPKFFNPTQLMAKYLVLQIFSKKVFYEQNFFTLAWVQISSGPKNGDNGMGWHLSIQILDG